MVDVTLQPLGVNIATPPDGGTELEVIVLAGLFLPFDTGTGQPLPVPFAQIRFPMGRDFALKYAESLKTEAEKLPKQSDIAVASSLQGIDQIADAERRIRGN